MNEKVYTTSVAPTISVLLNKGLPLDANAKILYDEIDRNPLFKGTTAVEDRSEMNVCFGMEDNSMDDAFMALTKQHGISGIKGHRSVGGFRASIYNAMPQSSVQVLVDLMKEFEGSRG